jgi:chromosome segregation ATPase
LEHTIQQKEVEKHSRMSSDNIHNKNNNSKKLMSTTEPKLLRQLKEQNEQLKTELEASRQENSEWKRQCEALEKEVTKLREDYENLKSKVYEKIQKNEQTKKLESDNFQELENIHVVLDNEEAYIQIGDKKLPFSDYVQSLQS